MGCGEGCGEVPKRFSGAWLVFGLLFVFAHEFLARILVRGEIVDFYSFARQSLRERRKRYEVPLCKCLLYSSATQKSPCV